MEIKRLDIKYLKNNTGQIKGLPKNPRILKDEKFNKLVKSIQDNPEMLDLRELIVYDNNGEMIVICGNMRLKAMKELKYKDAPCKVLSTDTDVEKLKAYTIKDNVSFGENDWDTLANEWDSEQLVDWGLDVPIFLDEPTDEDLISDGKKKPPILKITFESPEQLQKAEIDIQELIDRKYKGAYFSVSAGEL
jgi:hypothetical protein